MSTPKFTVAICGGGIGGLIAAIAISRLSSGKKDIRIDIYEAAREFTEIGAGVAMFLRPWGVMKTLGLKQELAKISEVPKIENKPRVGFELHKSDQATRSESFYEIMVTMGILTFHRAEFLMCLAEQLDSATTSKHFSKRLISYTLPPDWSPSSPITLNFKDGTTATCDVLIGADGIHSATRHTLLGLAANDAEADGSDEGRKSAETLRGMVDPVWSGSVAYRAVIPRERLEKLNPNHRAMRTAQNYMGKNKHLIVFPLSQGRLINVVAFCSWPEKEGTIFEGKTVEERSKAELLEQYVGWEEEVQQVLQCMDSPSLWAINALKGLPISSHSRVALVGDATHAMTPHQGSGAGQAIEDAYILASILAHPLTTLASIPAALKVYETVRLPHANDVQRRSRENGKLYEFADPRFADLNLGGGTISSEPDPQTLWKLGDAIFENWKWAWTTDIEDDRKKAIALLEERVSGEK
ncbi:FAD/NAD-binding domain-containing protein [Phellopilus nigrolimitatus]|nr:FAD/NAD-binding domain-containing protein [Phellopilus nigrolimitatus]